MNLFKEYVEYLKDNPQGYWFKRKLYGWGWTPSTWQGWLVLITYLVVVIGLGLSIDENSNTREMISVFFLPLFVLTIVLIRICYRKGEKPCWQWGPKDIEKNN